MRILAVILTGGRSRRLGGRHKPAVPIGGRAVVARVVDAVHAAGSDPEIIVAGSGEGVPAGVRVVREDPPYAGPVAGLAAALAAVSPRDDRAVLLLGGDMPFLTARVLDALVAALTEEAAATQGTVLTEPVDVAACVDEAGRLQYLCTAWNEAGLRRRLAELSDPANQPIRVLLDGSTPRLIPIDDELLADIDTPEDLDSALRAARSATSPESRDDAP